MVRATMAWPMLNSPSVPRSETIISTGIWNGTGRDASTFGKVAKPLVCISTMPRMPPIQAPETMPDGLFLARGGEGGEERIGVDRLDQRAQHVVGHVGDQAHIVRFQRIAHDLVPRSG